MGLQSLVYGVIEIPSHKSTDETGADRALAELPEIDEWPFLVQSMFSQSIGPQAGLEYVSRVVHFGASFKELESEWGIWIEKFESLLHKIQGLAAVVHIESESVGNHKLEWVAAYESGACEWRFVGGPRNFFE